jgi:hypothetical protein
MMQVLFYVSCREDGEEGVSFYSEPWVQVHGGVDALEANIHKVSKWYSPIGEAELPSHALDPEKSELLGGTIKALLEAWIEKGAPTINGAVDSGVTGSRSSTFTGRYFFYKFREKDGQEKLTAHSEAQVQEYGGIEALESAISHHTSWFYPIGTLLFPTWVEEPGKGIEIPYRRIKALVDTWLEQGSPWKRGKFAQDVDAPPKGHPLDDE